MIKLIPLISVSRGKVVRLAGGDYLREKIYEDSPVDFARIFADIGIETVHLVDLEGAVNGKPVAFPVIEAIAGHTNLKIAFAGGLRTNGDILKVWEAGASFISVASIPVKDKELFTQWLFSYGREKVTLSADEIDGKVVISGWQKQTDIDLFSHIEYFYSRSLKFVKVTDVSRDGTMVGPNFELYENLVSKFPDACIVAAGGVRSANDIQKLQDLGVYGVIFGKAFYEGKINLSDLKRFLA
jgi:phosphoribosylformimino-5-aminoimidazole carboxamide ribotide isomerase